MTTIRERDRETRQHVATQQPHAALFTTDLATVRKRVVTGAAKRKPRKAESDPVRPKFPHPAKFRKDVSA